MSPNRTPPAWKRDGEWRYGPTKLVVSLPPQPRPPAAASTGRPDPLQLSETAGESDPPPARRPSYSIVENLAFLLASAAFLGALYLLADWMVQIR